MEREIIFWNGAGQISPDKLYQFLVSQGIGNYFSDNINKKNTNLKNKKGFNHEQ